MFNVPDGQPHLHISIVAEILGLHPQTIRNYERMGLVNPSRTEGNMRLFSMEDLVRVKKIQSYTNAGVNLAGVEIIMKLLDQLAEMKQEMDEEMSQMRKEMENEIQKFHNRTNKEDSENK